MIARFEHVTYTYPRAGVAALRDVNLNIETGAFALVTGPSAGGKSTLLRMFNGLVPQFYGGRLSGAVLVAGLDPTHTPSRQMARTVGMVFQEPEAQGIAAIVEDEIAFGMEQNGIPCATMRSRIDALTVALGLRDLVHRRLTTLSGGERQRVAIAAALALEPAVLVLDEPTSQLDPEGALTVAESLAELHRRGMTIIVSEHRLTRFLPRATSVVEVADGLVRSYAPREAIGGLQSVPAFAALWRLAGTGEPPLSPEEAAAALTGTAFRLRPRADDPAPGDVLLAADGLTVHFDTTTALRGVSLSLREGEVVALTGANGSGKSTLLRAITGLVRPTAGTVCLAGLARASRDAASVQERTARAGMVPQDPAIALYRDTVRDEILESLAHRGLPKASAGQILENWGVGHLADRNPRDISVGQQQRVAIAAMLAHGPRVWLMDEPTRGVDGTAKEWLGERLRAHAAAGGAAIVATHDIESAAGFATRVVGLDRGEVVFDHPARQAFSADGPLPTQTARLVLGAIHPNEVML